MVVHSKNAMHSFISTKTLLSLIVFLQASSGFAETIEKKSDVPMDHSTHMAMDHSAHIAVANATVPTSLQNTIVPTFELTGAEGNAVNLTDYRGNYTLLTFGFTHCDFVCPTIAATMANVLKRVDNQTKGIFISVDTERDTPSITDHYAKAFHPDMSGLSGSYQQVTEAANNFKLTFVVTKTQKNYSVQHGASIYLIDPKGKLVDIFTLNTSTEEIAAVIDGENS